MDDEDPKSRQINSARSRSTRWMSTLREKWWHRVTHRAARLPLDKSAGGGTVDNPTSQGSTYRQNPVQTNETSALLPARGPSQMTARLNNQSLNRCVGE